MNAKAPGTGAASRESASLPNGTGEAAHAVIRAARLPSTDSRHVDPGRASRQWVAGGGESCSDKPDLSASSAAILSLSATGKFWNSGIREPLETVQLRPPVNG